MGYTTTSYGDVEPVADGMHFLRDPLETEAVGFTVLECDPEWSGQPHDHADEDHEEVYFLVEGDASVEIEGRTVDLDPGDAVRIDPEDTRQLRVGDTASRLVLVGADR
ncbi:MAG: cupin domain-containing protein [Halobacteriaceae archaeon]